MSAPSRRSQRGLAGGIEAFGFSDNVGNRGSETIMVFALDDAGGVRAIYHLPMMGRGPRAVTIDPTGQYLLVANCDSGDLVSFGIEEDRRLTPVGSPVPVPSPSSFAFSKAARA